MKKYTIYISTTKRTTGGYAWLGYYSHGTEHRLTYEWQYVEIIQGKAATIRVCLDVKPYYWLSRKDVLSICAALIEIADTAKVQPLVGVTFELSHSSGVKLHV